MFVPRSAKATFKLFLFLFLFIHTHTQVPVYYHTHSPEHRYAVVTSSIVHYTRQITSPLNTTLHHHSTTTPPHLLLSIPLSYLHSHPFPYTLLIFPHTPSLTHTTHTPTLISPIIRYINLHISPSPSSLPSHSHHPTRSLSHSPLTPTYSTPIYTLIPTITHAHLQFPNVSLYITLIGSYTALNSHTTLHSTVLTTHPYASPTLATVSTLSQHQNHIFQH